MKSIGRGAPAQHDLRSLGGARRRGVGARIGLIPIYHVLPPTGAGPEIIGLDTAGDLTAIDYYFWDGTAWQLVAVGAVTDEKVKVTSDDTTANYLLNKLAAGTGITLTELNPGADEDVEIKHATIGSGNLHPEYMTPAEHTAVGDGSPHHAAVTLAGAPDYITIAGQVITRSLINLTSHVTGLLPWANLNKTGSSLADLATRSHTNLTDAPVDAHHARDHAATHGPAGADALRLDDLEVPQDNTDLNASLTAHGLLLKLGGGTTNFLRADGTWAAPAGGGSHNLLDGSTHPDTVAQTVSPGSLIYGNATSAWDELAVGAPHSVLWSDGTNLSWTTAPELQYIKDTGGTTRYTTAAAGTWLNRLTGATRFDDNIGLLSNPSTLFAFVLAADSSAIWYGLQFTLTYSGSQSSMRGVNAAVAHSGSSTVGDVIGGWYQATKRTSGTHTSNLIALHVETRADGENTATWNESRVIEVGPPNYAGAYYTTATQIGILIEDQYGAGIIGSPTTVYSLKIDDINNTPTNKYLIHAGPSTPYLRLVGGANPAANQTNLWLKEQSTLRHVQWKDAGAGGANLAAGDRVMILV